MGDARIRAVLFDIDGTLITTGGASAHAWRRAFEKEHGVSADISRYAGAGMTDPQVGLLTFRGALERDPSQAELAKVMAARLRYLPEEIARSDTYRVMPGAEELLEHLVEAGCLLGLTTGNVEAAAHMKLARAGLNRFFSFGGYGSDSTDRTKLTMRAIERARTVAGGALEPAACMSVGDTPNDVEAAHGAGIVVVGVATGKFTVEELRDAGADHVIATLEEGLPL